MRVHRASVVGFLLIAAISMRAFTQHAWAAGTVATVTFKDGHIEPQSVTVAAGKSFQLRVANAGKSAIEFESFSLNRERVVAPGQTVTLYIPALDPGSYHFVDDFHRETGKGTIFAH